MSIRVRSYAKINWVLEILFKREDGYHELRTIFQTVSLYDRLIMEETNGDIQVVCNDSRVPGDETNLVHKAATRLRNLVGVSQGVRIEIEKRVPPAGGLGGGSSNAASTLLGLIRIWGVKVSDRELVETAMSIGSDVPFFLLGGTALGIGRGEEVYPMEEIDCESILLVNPGVEVSTAAAYARVSQLTRQDGLRIIPLTLLAAKGIQGLPLAAGNDLEEVVQVAHPEIAEVKTRLTSLGSKRALMSGSGATVFGVFDNLTAADRARDQLRADGLWAETVRTIGRLEYQATLIE
jgi:4-diphosphocytidyl-2-C-methyl-D-erythritol kinase